MLSFVSLCASNCQKIRYLNHFSENKAQLLPRKSGEEWLGCRKDAATLLRICAWHVQPCYLGLQDLEFADALAVVNSERAVCDEFRLTRVHDKGKSML